jgi:hypothetical protein
MNGEGIIWDRDWQIVRADLGLAHVFAPRDKISFKAGKNGGWTVNHNGKPAAYLQKDMQFKEVQGYEPSLDVVTHDYPLPLFTVHHKHRYRTLADKIEAYIKGNPSVRRLEGEINIDCHGFAYQAQESHAADDHKPAPMTVPIRVYQFQNAVEKTRRLLVIYKPLHSLCASNGDGTVIGYD